MSQVHSETISDENGVDGEDVKASSLSLDNEGLCELVFEKSNRFSASWKFLRANNRSLLEGMTGGDWVGAKVILFLNFPVAYTISLISAKYSSQNLGYKF